MTTEATARSSGGRRLASWLHRHPRARVGALLAGPVAWLVLAYLGSLAILLLSAFWESDAFSGRVVPNWTLASFQALFTVEVYRTIAARTIVIAIAVTLTDALIAFPIAYYMARVASRRLRSALFVLVLLPLWASYLVKVYAWRVLLAEGGPLEWLFGVLGVPGVSPGSSGASLVVVFAYLWLPYMILPIYAGLERIPSSLLEASADLGGRGATTFRRIVLPLVLPALAAGSIFTFSLTLGDYITPKLVGNTQFIGNVVFEAQGVANNVPFAAAFATVPILIMGVYLLAARRLGAFDAL